MLMWDSGNMIGLTDILIHSTQNKLTILKKKILYLWMKFEYITSKQNLKSDIHLQNNEKVLHVILKILF